MAPAASPIIYQPQGTNAANTGYPYHLSGPYKRDVLKEARAVGALPASEKIGSKNPMPRGFADRYRQLDRPGSTPNFLKYLLDGFVHGHGKPLVTSLQDLGNIQDAKRHARWVQAFNSDHDAFLRFVTEQVKSIAKHNHGRMGDKSTGEKTALNFFIPVDLAHANLSDLNLRGINLSKLILMEADFDRAILSGAVFAGCDLRGTSIQDAVGLVQSIEGAAAYIPVRDKWVELVLGPKPEMPNDPPGTLSDQSFQIAYRRTRDVIEISYNMAERARALDDFPDGYGTNIGEQDCTLSGDPVPYGDKDLMGPPTDSTKQKKAS
ncbi:MAG: pentapeptide repeat-containing protein [Deltaproteobacteria bacterium]|nr:pentapeptide repeat-containing protein [Deltaproteobacteria bacterium]